MLQKEGQRGGSGRPARHERRAADSWSVALGWSLFGDIGYEPDLHRLADGCSADRSATGAPGGPEKNVFGVISLDFWSVNDFIGPHQPTLCAR